MFDNDGLDQVKFILNITSTMGIFLLILSVLIFNDNFFKRYKAYFFDD